ncbi:glycoside hydrolase family 32 protein [Sutcliffiella horikoshii]|uniref:glycoside hydrolase family 32 protein n=1 Tax=Sutcliffiella horikoshii TaxID=79883 RepID=UPI001F2A1A68|nr:glycoside hydrolase family 32 protein [Sutcliffiella horikoshii]MCG1023645.1 glycoside hydrolase family 32 protein [Sutcliffiella horikoshii]
MDNHNQALQKANQSIHNAKERVKEHHWRERYHVEAPAYWINDPNGFSFFNGEYHLFYQHHPYDSTWGPMHWGHVKSRDLATWEHLPIALAPSEDYDRDGCFSGSAFKKDGKLYLMYTGNVWTGPDHESQLKQVQAIAVSEDGIHFTKIENNPVITKAPEEGDIHPFHFRDPKVWQHDDSYYCVLGSRTKDHIGQVLLYKSQDLVEWEFVSVMAKGEGNFGYMWECPDFFELEGQGVLVMSPQGLKPEGHKYQNLHQAGYILGSLNYETGKLSQGSFEMLDHGFDFYAPQTTIDEKGRRIAIAWMNMWESKMPEQEVDWAGAMTIPRELKLKDGKIISSPVEELKSLRKNEISYTNLLVEGETSFPDVSGTSLELELEIHSQQATRFGLKLRKSETEETVITYDVKEQMITLDREKSGQGPGGVRQAPLALVEKVLKLQVYLDSSSIEVFINGGEKVMTARIYPSEQAQAISFFADDQVTITSLKKWEIR